MKGLGLIQRVFPLVFLIFGLFAFSCYAASAYADIPVAQVVWVKGSLKAIAQDKKERELKRSDFVYEHEILKTDEKSTGQIVFSDSALMSIREATEFKIDTYKYAKDGPPAGNKFIGDLVKGGFRTVTGAISKDHPENYQVNTPVATIGVRGTEYTVYLNERGELEVSIEKGAIKLQNSKGSTDLDVNSDLIYAIVRSKLSAPAPSKTPPPGLKGQPPIEPAKPSNQLKTAAAAAVTGAGGSSSGGTGTGGGTSGGTGSGRGSSGSGGSYSGSSGGGGGGCGSLNIGS